MTAKVIEKIGWKLQIIMLNDIEINRRLSELTLRRWEFLSADLPVNYCN